MKLKIMRYAGSIALLSAMLVYLYLPAICLLATKVHLLDASVGGITLTLAEDWAPGLSSESIVGRVLFRYPDSSYLLLMKGNAWKPGYSALVTVRKMESIDYDKVARLSTLTIDTVWGPVAIVDPIPPATDYAGVSREYGLLLTMANPQDVHAIERVSRNDVTHKPQQ